MKIFCEFLSVKKVFLFFVVLMNICIYEYVMFILGNIVDE